MADTAVMARMRLALDLHDLGVRMYAQRLRREQPEATEADIKRQVRDWIDGRPMDAPGKPRPFR